MPVLRNKKHEAVVQLKASGKTPEEAYTCVYGAQRGSSSSATRLFKRREVQARLRELEQKQAEIVADVVPQLVQRDALERSFRIALLQTYLNKIEEVFAARASDPAHFDVPGYKTGIVAVTIKEIGIGEKRTTIKEGAIDVGALKELRAHGEQISKECGDWVERHTEEYQDPSTWPDSKLDAKIAAKEAEAKREMQAAGVTVEAVN